MSIVVAYDTETTGFSKTYDRVIQIAAVLVKSPTFCFNDDLAISPGQSFCSYINPGEKVVLNFKNSKAAQITGISTISLENAPPFPTVWVKFRDWVHSMTAGHDGLDVVLVGHNSRTYDNHMLCSEHDRHSHMLGPDVFGSIPMSRVRFGDTLDAVKSLYPNRKTSPIPNNKLGTMYEYWMGKPLENAHDALADCVAVASLLSWPDLKRHLRFPAWDPVCTDSWKLYKAKNNEDVTSAPRQKSRASRVRKGTTLIKSPGQSKRVKTQFFSNSSNPLNSLTSWPSCPLIKPTTQSSSSLVPPIHTFADCASATHVVFDPSPPVVASLPANNSITATCTLCHAKYSPFFKHTCPCPRVASIAEPIDPSGVEQRSHLCPIL